MSAAVPIICAGCGREIILPGTMTWFAPNIVYHPWCAPRDAKQPANQGDIPATSIPQDEVKP